MIDPIATATGATNDKLAWTAPVLEEAGTIHDVQGGANPGLDGNGLPAAHS